MPATKKRSAKARQPVSSREAAGSVILQARVDDVFAEELLGRDAAVLGLAGASEVVREGLRLVHRRAQEQALINSYDAFYAEGRAPLPSGVAAPDGG